MTNGSGSSALVILIVLIVGYITTTFSYRFKYQFARETGYKLYFAYGFVGLIIFVIAKIAVALGAAADHLLFNDYLRTLRNEISPYLKITRLNIEFGASILISMAAISLYNQTPNSKKKNLERAAEKDDLSKLFLYCLAKEKILLVTLESNKIYIGLVQRTDEPIDRSHLTILPLFSGYRDKETQILTITNDYVAIFNQLLDQPEDSKEFTAQDLCVVIPVSRIVSAHTYNPYIYNALQQAPHPNDRQPNTAK